MIDINKLYCGKETDSDALRYGEGEGAAKTASERRPVVVWNTTRTCNLRCIHCYTDSENRKYSNELTTDDGKTLIDDLAQFKIPALLFSGGEPLVRHDLLELANYAKNLGIRPTLSTNGNLIDPDMADKIISAGFTYVGISLDGLEEVNDKFRGSIGAFKRALSAFRNLKDVGQKVGLRMTLTRHNTKDLNRIFDFIEEEGINRVCFYHLVYSGRGRGIAGDDLSHGETRAALDIILKRTQDFYRRGLGIDVLTVDNHADGIYLYLKLLEDDPARAAQVLKLLKWNGGGRFSSGVGIADIDPEGNVHPDQFWMHYSFGNVKKRKFSDIWMDTSDPLMAGLKNRLPLLKGRCGACKWKEACGGALRVRADLVYRDPWAEDPACYLTDEEIGLKSYEPANKFAVKRDEEPRIHSQVPNRFAPRLIFFELTNRCNLNCIHCRASAIKTASPDEMSTKEVLNFIDDVASFAKPIMVLTGGEPLYRPDIFEIITYTASKGLKAALATNGTMITPEIAKKIKDSGVARVSISLDGSNAKTHDSFRMQDGSFMQALAGIEELKKAGVGFQINTTVSKHNISEIPAIYELALKLKAEAFHIFLLVPVGCGLTIAKEKEISPEQYEEVLNWYYDREQEGKIELKATCAPHYYRIRLQRAALDGKKLGMARGCLAGSAVCFVSHKGDVQPCGYLPLIAGNVRKEHFKDIWDKSTLFADLRNPSLLKGKCGDCEYKVICEGCRARAYAETSDYMEEEPFCTYEPLNHKIVYEATK